MIALHNFQKFRVLWHGRTKLTNVMKMIYPYPRYLWHWRTELPEVPGTGMNVIQNYGYECYTELLEVLGTGINVPHNSQNFFVRYYPG